MTSSLKDAYIVDDLVIFGGPHRGGHVAKGYRLEVPSLSGASPGYRNELEVQLVALLRSVDSGARFQVNWSTDSDFGAELVAFHDRTEGMPSSEWSRRTRNERAARYLERVGLGVMRKEQVTMFVSRPCTSMPTSNQDELRRRSEEMARSFDGFDTALKDSLGAIGGSAQPLQGNELAKEFARFLNPLQKSDLSFDPEASILTNFQLGDGVGVTSPAVGFYMAGAFHGVVTLQSLPQASCSGLIAHLTGLALCNLAICASITPLVTAEEITREEAEIAKLERALAKTRHARMEASLGVHRERIARMVSAAIAPFRAQFVIRVWDTSMEGVQSKLSIVKAAVLRMNSAKPCELAFPTTAANFFRCATPGWSWDPYRDYDHYMEDRVLANLIPISGSFNAGLEKAEALYDDGRGGLVGISGFGGEAGAETPLHTLVTGKTGSGKSLLVNDLLTQTEPHYDFTVIIDDGFSYGGYVRAVGGKSFVVEPGGAHTFNYLDPRDALTPQHLADAAAIILEMTGAGASPRTPAVVTAALKRFYADVSTDWTSGSPIRVDSASREAILLRRFAASRPKPGRGAWSEFRAAKNEDPSGFQIDAAAVTDDELLAFRASKDADGLMKGIAFSLMKPEEMPIHSDFCHWLEVEALSGSPDSGEMVMLAESLRRWSRDGDFGALFDGVGTFTFDSSIIHLELGRIPESAKDLRRVSVMLVCNQVRNELLLRPRSQRKRLILEELSSFLEIPNTERIVREFFERGRKYGVWIVAVIQQVGERAQSPAFVSIIGNTQQGIFLKQTSAMEANLLSEAFRLPDSAREALLSLPNPSREHGAGFLLCTSESGRPVVSVGFNVVHPEMLFIAGSSGGQHERREVAMENGEDLLEAATRSSGG